MSKKEIAESIINVAFAQARKKAPQMKKGPKNKGGRVDREANKIKIVSEQMLAGLRRFSRGFPSIERMQPLHQELLATFAPIADIKKSLAHLEGSANAIGKLRAETVRKIFRARDTRLAQKLRGQFYGRACSYVERAEESMQLIKAVQRELSQFPKINAEMPTAILAGYPNTGKTTILKRLTTSAPEIAPYPFTTKGINIGHFKEKFFEVQVIDTPGLLDRPMSERNPVERRAISALRHLKGIIVFIFDPTETCGFSLQKQMNLLEEVKKQFEKPLLVVANKADIASIAEIAKVPEEKVLEGEGRQSELKQKILGKLGFR